MMDYILICVYYDVILMLLLLIDISMQYSLYQESQMV